jgi:hypothetical protein
MKEEFCCEDLKKCLFRNRTIYKRNDLYVINLFNGYEQEIFFCPWCRKKIRAHKTAKDDPKIFKDPIFDWGNYD